MNVDMPTLVSLFGHESFKNTRANFLWHSLLQSAGITPFCCSPYDLNACQPTQLIIHIYPQDPLLILFLWSFNIVISLTFYSPSFIFPIFHVLSFALEAVNLSLIQPLHSGLQSGSQLDKSLWVKHKSCHEYQGYTMTFIIQSLQRWLKSSGTGPFWQEFQKIIPKEKHQTNKQREAFCLKMITDKLQVHLFLIPEWTPSIQSNKENNKKKTEMRIFQEYFCLK